MTLWSWWLRGQFRERGASLAGIVAMIALTGGLALAGVTGALRTDTALARQAEVARVSDVALIPRSAGRPDGPAFTLAQIRRLPEVLSAYAMPYLYFRARTASGDVLTFATLHLHDSPDPAVGRTVDRVKILVGRRSNPNAPGELMLSAPDAAALGLHVGSRLDVRFGSPTQQPGLSAAVNNPSVNPATVRYLGPQVTLRVVGLYAGLGTLAIDFGGSRPYRPALLTAAFYRRYHATAIELPLIFARLHGGLAAIPALARSLARLTPNGATGYQPIGGATAQLQRRVDVDVIVLWILAGLFAGLGLLVIVQALARLAEADASTFAGLFALGLTRRRSLGFGLARAGVLGVLGSLAAVAVAVALSPLTPVGDTARLAEPAPGVSVNLAVLIPGAAAVILIVLLAGLTPTARASAMAGADARILPAVPPRRMAGAWTWGVLPLSGVLGARLALPRGDRRYRSPYIPAAVSIAAIATLAAIIGCGASFGHLVRTPALYGQNWEFALGGGGAGSIAPTVARLDRDPMIAATVPGGRAQVMIEGQTVGLLGIGPGPIRPTVTSGHAPRGTDEILLGRATLAAIHRRVGDVVAVSLGTLTMHMLIVATGVIPDINETLRLGNGAITTFAGLRRLDPAATVGYAFVRLRHPDRGTVRRFEHDYGAEAALAGVPTDLNNVEQAVHIQPLIEALLGLVATLALLQALGDSARARERELALLKTFGLVPGQLRAVVIWQALLTVLVALAVGLPLGILAGRWLWLFLADQLGVASVSVVPAGALGLLALAALLAAVAVATIPGVRVARLSPARVLRSE